MANKTSQHILSTAANLLGFCLFVITALHLSDYKTVTIVDELTSFVALLLTLSAVLSFLSIRTDNDIREEKLERVADYFFMAALLGIFSIIMFIVIYYMKN